MTSKDRKILVLGGSGAIGVYLVPELLRAGYEVYVTSRSKVESEHGSLICIQGDAKDDDFLYALLEERDFDVIVDFMVYTTAEFEARVARLLRSTGHYIFLSSYRVYADLGDLPLTEESPRLLDVVTDEKYLSTDEYALAKARQEDVLQAQRRRNWTVVRPAITYSTNRFQLGTMEANEFLVRASDGKKIVFPREMLDRRATMTWAGDVARMISKLILNKEAHGEIYTLATSEHHTWREILDIYKKYIDLKVKVVSLEDYTRVVGRPYQVKYDRMYNRVVDNRKILETTGIDQNDLMPLGEGLRFELNRYVNATQHRLPTNLKMHARMDNITRTNVQKIRAKLRPRTRIRQIRSLLTNFKFDGAIVTLTVYNNYGNVIQRYALQRFLEINGLSFRILDLKEGQLNPRQRELKRFSDQYLIQDKYHRVISRYYRTYIVGSDQVWRHFSVNKSWRKYSIQFLRFVRDSKARRIAYAASFGVDTLEEAGIDIALKEKIRPLLTKFDAVSVREGSGVVLAGQLGAKDVFQAIDPTLLIDVSEYDRLIDGFRCDDKYLSKVFYYLIQETRLTEQAVRYYEESIGAKSLGILPYDPSGTENLPPIEMWLKAIRDAEIVVTDSYHALIFSLVFHTDFVVFDKQLGGIARIYELLKPLGLTDRIVIQGETKEYYAKHEPIDWQKVDSILKKRRKDSSGWLLDALQKKRN